MSSPSTRTTLKFLDKAEFLRTSIRTQLAGVNPPLTQTYSQLPPRAEGEPARQSGWGDVQLQNAELIDQAILEVKQTSQAYKTAKIRVSDFARDRRKADKGLRKRHRAHQKIFRGSCGERGQILTGLDKPPVTTMLGMREQSTLVLDRYEDPAMPEELAAIPKEETNGSVPDLATLAQELRQDVQAFEAAQDNWTEAKKIRDEAFVTRAQASRRLRRVVANVARVQEGYYRLAGLDDLADRLRLTVRGSRSKKPAAKADGAPEAPEATEPDEGGEAPPAPPATHA